MLLELFVIKNLMVLNLLLKLRILENQQALMSFGKIIFSHVLHNDLLVKKDFLLFLLLSILIKFVKLTFL